MSAADASTAAQLIQDDSDPTVYRQVTSNIATLSTPFMGSGFLRTGGRTTIVRLQTGGLVVISPIEMSETVHQALKLTKGDVLYIIAPNLQHYLQIAAWKAAFPAATLIAPEGLQEKCAKSPTLQDTKFDIIFTKTEKRPRISEEFDAEFEVEYVDSSTAHEIALFHKPSRSLIEADLLFNLPSYEQFSRSGLSPTAGLRHSLLSPIFSGKQPAKWQKRLVWYSLGAKDRDAFRKSLERIGDWSFDRIIPCHGDVIEGVGKEFYLRMFEWYLTEK